MRRVSALFLILCVFPLSFLAQARTAITMDREPHHLLVIKNDIVKVFEMDLAPRDAMSMHRHDHDEVSIALGDATTVSTIPGQADILTISKPGDVGFARGGWEQSVRNIGQTPYRSISIDLLHTQTGARNLCGTQIPNLPEHCPVVTVDANAPRVDLPLFETDRMRVTLTRIRPRQQATLGESGRDNFIVTIDEAAMAGTLIKSAPAERKLGAGSRFWIERGGAGRTLKNNSDKEVRVVTVSFKP